MCGCSKRGGSYARFSIGEQFNQVPFGEAAWNPASRPDAQRTHLGVLIRQQVSAIKVQ
jgi:hypothetical protein